MHGQDHLTRLGSRCNRDGRCIYGFPQHRQQSTTIDEHGRVHWRRREDEDIWVVPYCPALLTFANCHFHFDVVYTAKVFSYLYKYLYKGPDTAHFAIEEDIQNDEPVPLDEIRDYQKARYLSAPEAAWRILNFEVTRKEPSVINLPIHLPASNVPQFRRQGGQRSSTSLLNHYFLRTDELAGLRYEEYFEQFILYPYTLEDELTADDYPERQ